VEGLDKTFMVLHNLAITVRSLFPTPVFPPSSHPCTNSYIAKFQAIGYMYLSKESDSQFSQASCGTHLYVMLAANLLLLVTANRRAKRSHHHHR